MSVGTFFGGVGGGGGGWFGPQILGGTIVGIDDHSMVSSALKHRHWMFFDQLTFIVFGWFSDFRGQWSNEKLKFSLKSSKHWRHSSEDYSMWTLIKDLSKVESLVTSEFPTFWTFWTIPALIKIYNVVQMEGWWVVRGREKRCAREKGAAALNCSSLWHSVVGCIK